eukprot:5304994-Amphidinium_carterae.1
MSGVSLNGMSGPCGKQLVNEQAQIQRQESPPRSLSRRMSCLSRQPYSQPSRPAVALQQQLGQRV